MITNNIAAARQET